MGKCLSKAFNCFSAGDDDVLLPDTILSDDARVSSSSIHEKAPENVSISLPPFTPPTKKPLPPISLKSLPPDNAPHDANSERKRAPMLPPVSKVNAMPINLGSIDRSGESEETRSQAKLDAYSKVCSEVAPYLYVGSDLIARDLQALEKNGITHILNLAGMVCDNYFENTGKFEYLKVYLEDGAHEDIECVFYDMIDYLDRATDRARAVSSTPPHTAYVHCSQGVSRSTSVCILYLMHVHKWDYDTAYQHVRTQRPITRPNPGFMCQLLAWHKRRTQGVQQPRLYRTLPQSSYTPSYLVARAHQSAQFSSSLLDPAACCVLHCPDRLYVWTGRSASREHRTVATRHAQRLQTFELAPEAEHIQQGNEPVGFWQAFSDGSGGFESRSSYVSAPTEYQSNGLDDRMSVPRVVPSDPDDDDNTHKDSAHHAQLDPHMYAYPDWDEVEMFDSDDLIEDSVFVFVPNLDSNPEYAFVWVGEASDASSKDDESNKQIGVECLEHLGLDSTVKISVVQQGSEDAKFWKMFKNG
eukprot:c9968_g1_i1.p1 GENE.c9968_g1_i1~~c9968_g1_i1.p1  ORF type:complete len:526 (+),score=99.74 c9968_g1_i1:126-1703(+)